MMQPTTNSTQATPPGQGPKPQPSPRSFRIQCEEEQRQIPARGGNDPTLLCSRPFGITQAHEVPFADQIATRCCLAMHDLLALLKRIKGYLKIGDVCTCLYQQDCTMNVNFYSRSLIRPDSHNFVQDSALLYPVSFFLLR